MFEKKWNVGLECVCGGRNPQSKENPAQMRGEEAPGEVKGDF